MSGRILIVDDERDMLTLLGRIVSEDTDYTAVTENTPEKALERLGKEPFDLVMTDLNMPGMSGITLMEKVRSMRPDVSVVILTAYATIETAVEATRKAPTTTSPSPLGESRSLPSLTG